MSAQNCDVCVITTIHGDFDNRVYFRQANSLLDAGLKVHIIAPWDFSKRSRQDFSFTALPFPQKRIDRIRHGWQTYRAASKVRAKTYIFHDNDFLPWGLVLQRRTGSVVVYDAHENIPEDIRYGKAWIPQPLKAPLSAIFRMVEEFVVRRLGETIVAVESLRRRFEAQGARAVLVRNFANFSVPDDHQNEKAILYTGDLSRDYGFENFLALARILKRRGIAWPLRIVDRFRYDQDLKEIFVRTVAGENLNVELLQPVRAEDMPSILRKGMIGLSPIPNLPNKALALPTKIFEYYAFGLVVLASDISGTRIALEDGRLGYLLPDDDMEKWVDVIEALIANPSLIAQYQQRGRQAARDTYNWSNERQVLVDYVKALCAVPPDVQRSQTPHMR